MQIKNFREKKIKHASNDLKYYKMNLNLLKIDFKEFCRKYSINYKMALKIGIKKSKKLVIKYRNDELDGNLSKNECEDLYKLVKDPWGCSKLIRHKIFSEIIFEQKSKYKLNLKRILILGGGVGGEFHYLKDIFPNAEFFITDISKEALKNLKKKLELVEAKLYSVKFVELDIFSEKILSNFLSQYSNFDLIVASGVFRYGKDYKTRYNSANFIFNNILNYNGIFSVIEVRQDPKHDSPYVLTRIEPFYDNKMQTKNRVNPTHFILYQKKQSEKIEVTKNDNRITERN